VALLTHLVWIFKKKKTFCQLRIKSEPFLGNLKFKSEHLRTHNLKPKRGFRSWHSYIGNSQTALKLNNATPRKGVTLRLYPLNKDISEVRFWCDDKLIDIQRVKNSDLRGVHF